MAHFTRSFRKNRKAWFAGLTIMVMFAFVFIPIIMENMQTGGRSRNPVAVKTSKYGSLTERQVEAILRQRTRLYRFLQQLQAAVQGKGGRGDAVRQALSAFGNSPANEEAAVDNWLDARRAEDLGFKVSEKAVNDYLASLTEGKAGNEDVRQILQRLHMSQGQLFEGLRQELLSLRLAQTFWISLAAATPAQRWGYYQQLNRRAKIEAVPLAASKFVDKVPTPSDDVLREFFDKHKERLFDPNSPEPGFREPHRIDIQYLKATVESFMDPAAVTEQAIRDYYEANKERLYKDMLPEAPPPVAPKTEPPKAAPPKTEPAKVEKTEPSKSEPAKAAPPKTEPPKTEPPKSPAKSEQPKSDPEKGKSPTPVPGKTSSLSRRSPFRLVSEQKTTAQTPAPKAEPPASKPAQPPAKAEAAASKPGPAAAKPEAAASKPDAAPPKAEQPPAAKAEPAASPAPVKYKPLQDVKEEIRKTLAREAAEAKIRDVLRRVQDRLAQFETQWTLYDTLEPDKKASTPPPVRPDFVALAKEHRLTAAETGPMSALQISGTDIGKSRVEGGAEFIHVAFEKSVPSFRPGISQDNEGNSYLFWEVHDTPERVPEFDEPGVRQQVLDAWKLVPARDLATQEAERLAAEARKAGRPLAQAFAGRKELQVLSPSPFTWLTFGNVPVWFRMRPPQYSEVTGISGAGTDFMRSVFALKAGEVGLATDQPKSTVYLVHLADYSPSESVLWDMFVADDYRGYIMASYADRMDARKLWREGIRAEAGLKWEREPFRGRGEIDE